MIRHSFCDPKIDLSCQDCFIAYNQTVNIDTGEDELFSIEHSSFRFGQNKFSKDMIDSGRLHSSTTSCPFYVIYYRLKTPGARTKSSSNAVNRVGAEGSLLV